MNNQIPVPENSNNRTIILVIILIVSLIVTGFFLFQIFNSNQTTSLPVNSAEVDKDFKVETKQLAKTDTPVGIPADLPVAGGSSVVQNFESTNSVGHVQSTKKFNSPGTVSSLLQKYNKYFTDLGWVRNVSGQLTSPALYLLEDNTLMVKVIEEEDNENPLVEITITQVKK